MNLPSKLLEDTVQAFAQLPGIGQKSALRMVLHLLKMQPDNVERMGETIIRLRKELRYCKNCHNIASEDICSICSDSRRDRSIVCVVEDVRDVIAIENTGQFKGLYHVLGGLISPMDGIGPSQLNIDSLVEKAASQSVNEIMVALSTTMEGDTTLFYLFKKIKPLNVPVSTLARGVAIGGELEYADEVTLGRSIVNRVPYDNQLVK
ncbi:MAG TPA: recombination mediator RecR [Bacteroidia bacterium]|nr:recombination mediator RecR [Bacteroidia bacterium]HQF28747.1 recombination mediator RecR [Bacteroidia bacterium]HQK98410.1 recombination mediator RecR [Bacteroidia bacterium]